MLTFLKTKSKSLIGLDISSSSLKMVEIARKGSEYSVENYGHALLPPDTFVDKRIQNPEVFARILEQLHKSLQTATREIAVAVSDSSIITKILPFDAALNDRELEEQIARAADDFIPYPLDEVNIDFMRLGKEEKGQCQVLLVACRSETINDLVEPIRMARLIPKVVDVESYTLFRACAQADMPKDTGAIENIAVFNIGASETTVTVIRQGMVVFTREEAFGGDTLVKGIQQHYQISYHQALEGLQQQSLPADFQEFLLEPFKDSIVVHIRRALHFFFSNTQHQEIHKIFLTGGNANIPNLSERISEELSVPVVIPNPFKNMQFNSRVDAEAFKRQRSSLLIAGGLSLRQFYGEMV